MLSLRANAGTNWPPPPFFLSASPSLYLFLHIYVSPPLLVAAPSFSSPPLLNPLSFIFSTALQYLTLFSFCPSLFPVTPPPPPLLRLPLSTFCMVFSGGATRQRNNSKSLHIAGALVSGEAPLHWHISLSGLTQQTAYAMTNSLDAASAVRNTHTHTHTQKEYAEHTLCCLWAGKHACLRSRQL